MSPAITSFRLIIINDSADEAQRLSSMFQNAGRPCRAQYIDSEEAFNKVIEEKAWDLVIAHNDSQKLSPAIAIRNIRNHERDLPVLLVSDENNSKAIIDGMKLGARDVIQLDDDQHLLLAVNRELENRQQRQLTRITQRRLKEVERRNQQLLNSSRDGIAYVQDGMFLYANDSFAEILGYSDKDDLDCLPIMDVIVEEHQQHVKETLKNFTIQQDSENNKTLDVDFILADGHKKQINIELFLGEYDDEPCTQFICSKKTEVQDSLEAEIENIKNTDATTGLYNKSFIIERIERAVDAATDQEIPSAVLYVDIDNFTKNVTDIVSIGGADQVIHDIAKMVSENCSCSKAMIGRISEHAFIIVTDEYDIEKLLTQCSHICQSVENNLFEIEKNTLKLTLSIGICLVNETITDSKTVIGHATQAIEELRKKNNGNGTNIYQKDIEENTVISSDIKKALEEEKFSLLFQPIISLQGEDAERYEVLLRMLDDDNKPISPTHFLQTAENVNLGGKIDRWVILESIKYLREHQKKSKNTQQFIHLNSSSLCDETLLPWLKVAFDASNIDPSSIIFQAKEMDIIQHQTAVKDFISQANSMGVEFCISSFGCALNPMELLEHINVKYIKIDGSFSQELQDNPNNVEALEKLVNDLHEQEKITTIPLVENASILSKLWQLGVHCIQGHYLQEPSPEMNYEFSTEN